MAGRDEEQQARPDSVGADSLPEARRNSIDLNNEIAGRDTGRAKRFLPLAEDARAIEKEREKERAFSSLMRAMQDPEYAKLYRSVEEKLGRAEEAASRAMEKLSRQSALAHDELRRMRDAAAELPDGRKVFRAKDGRLFAEDSSDVTKDAHAIKGLRPDGPSWDDYQNTRDKADDLDARMRGVETYQRDVLAPTRQRLGDEDNSYSKDELKDISDRLDRDAPADMAVELRSADKSAPDADRASKHSAADHYVSSTDINAPELLIDFVSARDAPAQSTGAPSPLPAPKSP